MKNLTQKRKDKSIKKWTKFIDWIDTGVCDSYRYEFFKMCDFCEAAQLTYKKLHKKFDERQLE